MSGRNLSPPARPAGWEGSLPGMNCRTAQLVCFSASFINLLGKHIVRTSSSSSLFSRVTSPGPVTQHHAIIFRDPQAAEPLDWTPGMLLTLAKISSDSAVCVHGCAFPRALRTAAGQGLYGHLISRASRQWVQWKGHRCCADRKGTGFCCPPERRLGGGAARPHCAFNSHNTSGHGDSFRAHFRSLEL